MTTRILDLIDFEKVDILLEGFNKSTGFVTAILDLEGNVLSKSGWRQICTEFHRIHPETSKKCTISDTTLANKMAKGEKYHFYQCLNGLIDVAVPIVIKGEHIANLFSGQFFFEEPDSSFFNKQSEKYGFNKEVYLKALGKVPVVSKEKVLAAMDFLLNMTHMISDMTSQKLEQMELNEAIHKNERILRLFVEHSPASIAMFDNQMHYLVASRRYLTDYNLGQLNVIGLFHYEVFPEISDRWKEYHRRGLAGETLKEDNDPFPRGNGKTDWVRWEIRPWYESETQIGGIILFSEVITAQIEDKEALKESEKYNRMLFDQSAVGLALTSLDGKLIDINPAYANILGRTIEEAKELTYWEITPEKYIDQEQQQLKDLDETGYYGPYEKEYIHKDGHFVPVRLQGKIIERNGVKYIWSSVEDITQRKLAEEKLRINELRLKKGEEIGHFGYWQQDIGSDVIWASAEAMKIFGFSPIADELTRNTIAACIRDVELVRQASIELIVNNKNYNIEFAIDPADGSPSKIISAVAELERDNDGLPVRIMGVLQDITERKQAEKSLLESNLRFRDTLENVHLISAQINFNGEVIYCNPYLCELSGYTREEIVGHDWFSIFLPDIRPDVKAMFLKAIQSSEIETLYENPIRIKDGSERIIRFSNTILRDPAGNVIGTTSIGEDITERKLAEAEIKTLNQTLERRVIERTAQLQAVNKELETFTYSVSHDLKAPLRGIDGYSKLLLDIYGKDLNVEAKTFLSTIRSSTLQMNQLIEDLLEYSRLERSQLSNEKIRIKNLISSITSIYKNELNVRNYSLEIDVQDIELVTDAKGISIALRNIIENAIKFTKGKSNPVIEIGLEETLSSWILRVKDNGIGFDMKYHQRIFEIFQRLQRAEDFQGTGVGLAMVSKAMQKMNGKVWAESAPGMGSTFYLEIPKKN